MNKELQEIKEKNRVNWKRKISGAFVNEQNNMATVHFWGGNSTAGTIDEISEKVGHYPFKIESYSSFAIFNEIERLQKVSDSLISTIESQAKQLERMKEIRYNATEAHTNIQSKLVVENEQLRKQLKDYTDAHIRSHIMIGKIRSKLKERIKEVDELIDIHADKIDHHRKINTKESINSEYFYRGYNSALRIERNRLEAISHVQGKEKPDVSED